MSAKRIPVADRLLEKREIRGDCWIFTGSVSHDGYGVMGSGRGRQLRAHRASYETFIGPIPDGMLVCHRCDTPLCVNPAHLFLGTPKDNTMDMIAKGRRVTVSGEAHGMARLSDVDVVSIKRLRSSGRTLAYVAERFGVSFQHVSAICRGIVRAK